VTFLDHARRDELAALVERTVRTTPVLDIHTHLYDPAFGGLLLWGVDDLLVYHYLVAEGFRAHALPPEDFFALPKPRQAEAVWRALFEERSPVSEACRGVLTTLHRLGLDPRARDLPALRDWFAKWEPAAYLERVLELAHVRGVTMTNSPFDDEERPLWEAGFARDPRFLAALRVDPLLVAWPDAARQLHAGGWVRSVEPDVGTLDGVRRFLAHWTGKTGARYLMVSLPPSWRYPDDSAATHVLEGAVLPHCREHGLPLALMIGVKRGVNPALRLAGDGVGTADLAALQRLCAAHPRNRFLATVLARENQHGLAVLARKFRNLHPFGCWWFVNVPSLVAEITTLRLELLGTGFTPQHSDARVLDQLLYKWDHSRQVIARVLTAKYLELGASGWWPTAAEVERDVARLLGGAFEEFCAG
jgi:hypothetical protein